MNDDLATGHGFIPAGIARKIGDYERDVAGVAAEPRHRAANVFRLFHASQRSAHGIAAPKKLGDRVLRNEAGRACDDDRWV